MEGCWLERTTIFYNDLPNSVARIDGELLNDEGDFVILRTDSKIIQIPKNKIIRIEGVRDGRIEAREDKKH